MQHTLNINGKTISADAGDTLVDAALAGKVLIPHDCATGQCETCRVRVAWGEVDGVGTNYGDTVLACQAKVTGDATLTFETAPAVETVRGTVESITALSRNVVEIVIRNKSPLSHKPGQYARLAFQGFPPRDYSFTMKLDGNVEPDQTVFQIKLLNNGRVSSAIGKQISAGHKTKLTGPFGNAFLREQETGPLVLAASGTGFAPIWSLARAVTLANDNRPMTIITGVNTPEDIYMRPAIHWLNEHNQKRVIVTAKKGAQNTVLAGTADAYLPALNSRTSVHAAGSPAMVESVRAKALVANAKCYVDPFTASNHKLHWRDRLRDITAVSRLLPKRLAS